MSRTRERRARRKRFKLYLFDKQDGLCHWCGKSMLLVPGPVKHNGVINRKMATFDHIDDRFSPERGKHPGTIRTVIACWQCNWERGKESVLNQPIEILREKSKHGERK